MGSDIGSHLVAAGLVTSGAALLSALYLYAPWWLRTRELRRSMPWGSFPSALLVFLVALLAMSAFYVLRRAGVVPHEWYNSMTGSIVATALQLAVVAGCLKACSAYRRARDEVMPWVGMLAILGGLFAATFMLLEWYR